MKILPVGQELFSGKFFTWYAHGTNTPLVMGGNYRPAVLLGNEITTMTF
jgi:hypothetical protein